MPRTIPQIPDIATGGGHGGYTPANYILSVGRRRRHPVENARGEVLARGITDDQGRARRVPTGAAETLRIVADEE